MVRIWRRLADFSTALKINRLSLIFWPLRGRFVFAAALSRLSSVSLGVTPMISATMKQFNPEVRLRLIQDSSPKLGAMKQ
jgi:preprotein translocase subunit SecY